MYNTRIMNSEAIIDDFISKPKIGRLPPSLAQDSSINKHGMDNVAIKTSFIGIALLAVIYMLYSFSANYSDSARLLALVNSTDKIIKPKSAPMYFRDSDGTIAGQMVKIAPVISKDNPATAEGGLTDRRSDRELLSIVTKTQ